MRKLLLVLLSILLISSLCFCQNTATISGNLFNLSGSTSTSTVQNAFVRFTLFNCGAYAPRVIGNGVFVSPTVDFHPDQTGAITGLLYKSSAIDCGGVQTTYYAVQVYSNNIAQGGLAYYLINSNFNFNAPPAQVTTIKPNQAIPVHGYIYRGVWDVNQSYSQYDNVTFTNSSGETSSYVALTTSVGQEPDTSPATWGLFASGGISAGGGVPTTEQVQAAIAGQAIAPSTVAAGATTPTIIDNTGVTFPDGTKQTTKATGGGTVNAGTTGQIAYYGGSGTSVSGTSAIPNGVVATTQNPGDNSGKIASTAYVDSAIAAGGSGNVTGPASATAGDLAALDSSGKVLSDSGYSPSSFARLNFSNVFTQAQSLNAGSPATSGSNQPSTPLQFGSELWASKAGTFASRSDSWAVNSVPPATTGAGRSTLKFLYYSANTDTPAVTGTQEQFNTATIQNPNSAQTYTLPEKSGTVLVQDASGNVAVGATNPITIGGATGSCAGKYVLADGTGCDTPAATTAALSRVGWTASASTTYSTDVPSLTLDGNTSTFWGSTSAGYPQSLIVNLGSAQTFSAIQLMPRQDTTCFGATSMDVYVSNDGSTWGSSIGTFAIPGASACTAGVIYTYSLSNTYTASYVKLSGTVGVGTFDVAEFNLLGVGGGGTDNTKLAIANNLSEIASAGSTAQSAARVNLGLGTAALQNTTAFDAAGLAAAETTRASAAEATLTTAVAGKMANTSAAAVAAIAGQAIAPSSVAATTSVAAPTVTVSGTPSTGTDAINVSYYNAHLPTIPTLSTLLPGWSVTGSGTSQTVTVPGNLCLGVGCDVDLVQTGQASFKDVYVSGAIDLTSPNGVTVNGASGTTSQYLRGDGVWATPAGSGAVSSLTTTGTSGAATLSGGVLNIPQYAGGGSMTWPSTAGIPYWTTGTAWGGAYNATTPIPANYVAAIPESQVTNLTSDLALKAPLASPTFTGTVAASSVSIGGGSAITSSGPGGALASGAFAATPTLAGLGGVATSVTVNGHALSSSVTVSASDITTGTLPHAQLPTLLSGDIPNNAANTSGTAANLTATSNSTLTTLSALSLPYSQLSSPPTIPSAQVAANLASSGATGVTGTLPAAQVGTGYPYGSLTGAPTIPSTPAGVGLSSVTNDVQTKAAIVPNTAPTAGQILVGNAGGTAYAPAAVSGDCTLASTGAATCTKTSGSTFAASATTDTTNAANISSGTLNSGRLAAQYKTLTCEPGLGDGLNAMATGTYLQSTCWNKTGVTWTLTGLQCYTDNAGSSTLNATNGAGTALLTGAVTCSSTIASGTQSGTTTIANGDFIKFTFVSDGTSKQTTWVVTGTY